MISNWLVKTRVIRYTNIVKILGDYHTHTNYSDGQTPVIEIVQAAKEKGLSEVAVTDHGPSKIIKGLRRKKFGRLIGDVQAAKSEMTVLLGAEANVINTKGKIDLDGSIRKDLDLLLFGVHVVVWYSFGAFLTFWLPNIVFNFLRFVPKYQIRRNTEIVKRVLEKNQIDIWTHPSRYFKVDVVSVAKTCVERGTLIELNSKRISFRPVDFERMAALGAKFIICSDAHSPKRVGDVTRAEEFLRNCDYRPIDIINLGQTYTEYKTGKDKKEDENISGGNQNRDTKQQGASKRKLWRH